MSNKVISFKINSDDLIKSLQKSKTNDNGEVSMFLTDVKDLVVYGEIIETKYTLTRDNYYRFEEIIKKNRINLKDIREIIMLAYTWWKTRGIDPYVPDDIIMSHLFYGYNTYKDEIKDKVYSEEFIDSTLSALSTCTNPVTDFYSRVNSVDSRDYKVFEDYFKVIYGTKK